MVALYVILPVSEICSILSVKLVRITGPLFLVRVVHFLPILCEACKLSSWWLVVFWSESLVIPFAPFIVPFSEMKISTLYEICNAYSHAVSQRALVINVFFAWVLLIRIWIWKWFLIWKRNRKPILYPCRILMKSYSSVIWLNMYKNDLMVGNTHFCLKFETVMGQISALNDSITSELIHFIPVDTCSCLKLFKCTLKCSKSSSHIKYLCPGPFGFRDQTLAVWF